MASKIPLLVFTDLDGTLLSHEDYSWDAAKPALDCLARIGAGVILASSKTAAEMVQLRQAMGLQQWPAVVENGAGLLEPLANTPFSSSVYARLCGEVTKIRAKMQVGFRGFADMDVAEVSRLTGLSPPAAQRAKQRAFSEPGLWSGSAAEQAEFLGQLEKQGIYARQGGRFLTLSFGGTKADQMARIILSFAPRHTIALGDAPNDVEMLEAADQGVVIANPHAAPIPLLKGEASGRIIRMADAGPKAWNAAILAHLARLKLD